MVTLRIALVNLQGGIGVSRPWQFPLFAPFYTLPHRSTPVKGCARFIRGFAVDVTACTESDGGSWRTLGENYAALFSQESGLRNWHFYPADYLQPLSNNGLSIHSRYALLKQEQHALPRGIEPRPFGMTSILLGERAVSIAVTHLSLGKRAREEQIRTIDALLSPRKEPLILLGDFNTDETYPLKGLRFFETSRTYPSWKPKHAFDRIYATRHWKLLDSVALQTGYSDHRALVSTLELQQ